MPLFFQVTTLSQVLSGCLAFPTPPFAAQVHIRQTKLSQKYAERPAESIISTISRLSIFLLK